MCPASTHSGDGDFSILPSSICRFLVHFLSWLELVSRLVPRQNFLFFHWRNKKVPFPNLDSRETKTNKEMGFNWALFCGVINMNRIGSGSSIKLNSVANSFDLDEVLYGQL